MSSDEFWSLTPRELHALIECWSQREEMANYRAGLAASAVYNVNRGKKARKMIQPLDFFGKRNRAQGTADISAKLHLLYSSVKLNANKI